MILHHPVGYILLIGGKLVQVFWLHYFMKHTKMITFGGITRVFITKSVSLSISHKACLSFLGDTQSILSQPHGENYNIILRHLTSLYLIVSAL